MDGVVFAFSGFEQRILGQIIRREKFDNFKECLPGGIILCLLKIPPPEGIIRLRRIQGIRIAVDQLAILLPGLDIVANLKIGLAQPEKDDVFVISLLGQFLKDPERLEILLLEKETPSKRWASASLLVRGNSLNS